MTTVVAAHAVGDMKTWLAGGDERKAKHTVIDPVEIYIEIDGGT